MHLSNTTASLCGPGRVKANPVRIYRGVSYRKAGAFYSGTCGPGSFPSQNYRSVSALREELDRILDLAGLGEKPPVRAQTRKRKTEKELQEV